ncbi:hypothetical protein VTO73DRAFT_3523 [Trametes versicolor]
MASDTLSFIPIAYRLFFLYIEPVSAIVGGFYAGARPSEYLAYLSSPASSASLANLYLLFALNEHLVLSSTTSRRTWRRLLFGLLVADIGHLATMVPLAQEKGFPEVFLKFWAWNAMEWGSVAFVYMGATMRSSFLLGVGLGEAGKVAHGKKE